MAVIVFITAQPAKSKKLYSGHDDPMPKRSLLMPLGLTKEQKSEVVYSLRRYFREELDSELSEMQAGFFLEYLSKEIAPLAYNKGVEDAQKYFLLRTEELTGTCFEEALTFWKGREGNARAIRRKPHR